ncbi:MAG: hypothetical protein ABI873_08520 [Marmoricola sp.]
MTTRVYLPTTLAALASYAEEGEVGPAQLAAHAVTDDLRALWTDGSDEEWEYAALGAAADACTGPRRAADVGRVSRAGPDEPTAVTLDAPFPMRLVAAVHADLTAADAEAGQELCWFAAQEIPDLLE